MRQIRKTIKEKWKEENGASIALALLLFLVCTVISMTILVAATAATGRMADMGQYDQRYYAVKSASDLLKDVFIGAGPSTVSYSLTYDSTGKMTGCTVTGLKDKDGNPPGQLRSYIDSCFLTAGELQNGNANLPAENPQKLFKLDCGTGYEDMACTVKANLSGGTLTLIVYNTPENATDDVFRLELVLSGTAEMSAGSKPGAMKKDVSWRLERMDKHPAITIL